MAEPKNQLRPRNLGFNLRWVVPRCPPLNRLSTSWGTGGRWIRRTTCPEARSPTRIWTPSSRGAIVSRGQIRLHKDIGKLLHLWRSRLEFHPTEARFRRGEVKSRHQGVKSHPWHPKLAYVWDPSSRVDLTSPLFHLTPVSPRSMIQSPPWLNGT